MPDNISLWLKVIEECYTHPAVGHLSVKHTLNMTHSHPGVERILNMMHGHYYWPYMQQTIEQYICNCQICRRVKAAWDRYNRLLQPLPVPKRSWIDVTIDFMIGLLKCHAYDQICDAILMVIDCLLKECHYILCLKDNKSTFAEVIAKLFMQYV